MCETSESLADHPAAPSSPAAGTGEDAPGFAWMIRFWWLQPFKARTIIVTHRNLGAESERMLRLRPCPGKDGTRLKTPKVPEVAGI